VPNAAVALTRSAFSWNLSVSLTVVAIIHLVTPAALAYNRLLMAKL